MFSKAHAIRALEAKRAAFEHYERRSGLELEYYDSALAWMADQDLPGLLKMLEPIPRPGALPTVERVPGRPVVRPFAERWANHHEARAWAMRALRGVTAVAVDGSQITPSRDFSIPVGAVQVGWFENPHDEGEHYTKDIRFEILAPEELTGQGDIAGSYPDLRVNLRRFELECEVLVEHMARLAGRVPAPVCFFDGSLIISFAAQMRPDLQRSYLNCVRSVLDASESSRVPLVGFVDTSYASDLVTMLRWLTQDVGRSDLADGAVLRNRMAWGDRTEALICARDDKLFERANQDMDYYERVLMVYLKTTADGAPARLDMPAWLLEAGELERVLDVVRAECVVGTGYPYAVETVDAVAVITAQDRERFYRTFQEFAATLGMKLRYSRKAYSKRTRR
jgi:hypothetical protein